MHHLPHVRTVKGGCQRPRMAMLDPGGSRELFIN